MQKHRLIEKNWNTMRGVCSTCGPVSLVSRSSGPGKPRRLQCSTARRANRYGAEGEDNRRRKLEYRARTGRNRYRKHLKTECERCGFIPVSVVQLDIHHKDENHNNHSPKNLETICANCHRLEHFG